MIDERAARQRGDVVRSALAPLAGALVGGFALASPAEPIVPFAARSLAGHASLDEARALLDGLLWAPLAGAFVSALAFGLLQTRGYVGWARARDVEPRRTPTWLALIAWALVLGVALHAAGRLITLAQT